MTHNMSRRGNRAGFSAVVLLLAVLVVVCLVVVAGILVYNTTSGPDEESVSSFRHGRETGVQIGAEEVLSNGVRRLYEPTGPDRGETLASGITINIGDQGGVPLYTLENVKFLKQPGGTSLFGSFSGGVSAGSGSVFSRWSGLFHGTVDQEGNVILILIGMAREGRPHQECEGRECNGDVEVWSGKIHPDAIITGAHLTVAEAKESKSLADAIRYFALGTIRYNVRLVQEQSRRKESSESNK